MNLKTNQTLLKTTNLKSYEQEQANKEKVNYWQNYEAIMYEILKEKINNNKVSPNKVHQLDLTKYQVLALEKTYFNNLSNSYKLSNIRSCGDIHELIEKYTALIALGGFIKEMPIVFDRDMNLLDGYQRLHACRITEKPFTYVILNVTTKQLEAELIKVE